MKQIFFVRSERVWQEISPRIDKKSVAAVSDMGFLEKYSKSFLPDEIPISGIDKIKDDAGGGYRAVIAVNTDPPRNANSLQKGHFFRLSLALARSLKQHGIKFSFWKDFSPYIHIYGTFPNFSCELAKDNFRTPKTMGLIIEVYRNFPQEFDGKKFDMWIAIDDTCATDALDLAKALDLPHVFSYVTSYAIKDRVIALPDFNCCYNEDFFWNPANSNAKCKEAAAQPWEDNRIFWRGSLFVSFSRKCLFELGKQYPQYLQIEDSRKGGQFIPMTAQAKYKYLLDTRGNSWSGRLQTLLKLGRVVFIADRPYREWYFDRLRPMEHYVPVQEDMSDLIDKFCYMEQHPELYDKIVANLREFVEENLSPRRILLDAKDLILRYGVVD